MNLANVSHFTPLNFATSPTGDLYFASGIGPIGKWDGMTATVQVVGVVAPTVAPTAAWSGVGSITGTYTAYYRFVDANGNFSNAIQVQTIPAASSNTTITYSGLQLPTNDGSHTAIAKRQLLRSTAGETATFYVDIETTDLTSTTLTSTNSDTTLTAATAVPSANLSLYGVPPTHKAAIANHLGRMFAAGEVVVDQGCAIVANGSTNASVIGFGGSVGSLVGRYLYVNGSTQGYKITGGGDTTVTLATAYADATNNYTSYAIRPAPAERRLIYYTQANLPEAWPASYAVSVPEDGDEITGLMPFSSFLYILEAHHVYRLTYQTDPGVDGGLFLALNRGCLNQRCWVVVEGTAYMMDDQGIHAYGGARESVPISSAVQDLFRFSDSDLRVNWAASRWFHAVHFSSQETIRWFVALSGSYLPYHAICYNYRHQRWWVEQWANPIGASALGRLGKSTRTPQVYLGSSATRILAMWQGTLDGVDASALYTGVPRGTVSFAGPDTFTSPSANFNAVPLNIPVVIVDGTGKGQVRLVVDNNVTGVAGQYVRVNQPWTVRPDSTSVYQFGGIPWTVKFGDFRYIPSEQLTERYVAAVFQPCTHDALMTLRLFTDFSSAPTVWVGDVSFTEGNGARTVHGSPDVVFDLTKPSAYIQKRMPGHKEFFVDGPRYFSVQLSGVSNAEPQRLYAVYFGGAYVGD